MEFLLRARTAGAAVPEAAIADGLKFLGRGGRSGRRTSRRRWPRRRTASTCSRLAGQGQPGRGAGAGRERSTSCRRRWRRRSSAAALALAHDTPRAEAAFAAALAAPGRRWWDGRLRHRAARPGGDRRAAEGSRPAAGSAAAAHGRRCRAPTCRPMRSARRNRPGPRPPPGCSGRDGKPAHIALDGHAAARSRGGDGGADRSGDRAQPRRPGGLAEPRGHAACRPRRRRPRAPDAGAAPLLQPRRLARSTSTRCKQNTVFVLLLEGQGRGRAGPPRHAACRACRRAGRSPPASARAPRRACPGSANCRTTEAQTGADDRFAAVVALTADKPAFRVAVRLRAVTPGEFRASRGGTVRYVPPGDRLPGRRRTGSRCWRRSEARPRPGSHKGGWAEPRLALALVGRGRARGRGAPGARPCWCPPPRPRPPVPARPLPPCHRRQRNHRPRRPHRRPAARARRRLALPHRGGRCGAGTDRHARRHRGPAFLAPPRREPVRPRPRRRAGLARRAHRLRRFHPHHAGCPPAGAAAAHPARRS